ncbi:MAG: sirohydrochlorin cobaltochelatase [Ruminococcus sp.]
MILAKIEKRDHIHYDNVKEAMERMAQDGIEEVIVQPTHVMNGVENDLMKADVLAAANHFQRLQIRIIRLPNRRRQCICGKNNYRCISCNSG